jgi:hypothetical protein
MAVFWVVTPCGLVGGYQRSEKHTASIFRNEVTHPAGPHGVTTQKKTIDIFAAMRTSNLIFLSYSFSFCSFFSFKKSHAFYGTRWFTTVFTTACHWILP